MDTLNTELDRNIALFDDQQDRIDRAVRLNDNDDAASMVLPLKASRKGTVLGFNATTGAAEAGPTIANVNSLADITTNINTQSIPHTCWGSYQLCHKYSSRSLSTYPH